MSLLSITLVFLFVAAQSCLGADTLASHYQQGQAAEQHGDMAAALKAYQWFDDPPQRFMQRWRTREADLFGDSAADAVDTALAYDRLYTLRGDYRNNAQLHQAVLDLLVQAYDVIDRGYWPAHVAAGDFFRAHDRPNEAAGEYQAALKLNPKAAGAILGLGRIAVESFDFDKTDQAVAALRKIAPPSRDADRLAARNLMRQQKPQEAQAIMNRLLKADPDNLTDLGLLAAAQAMAFTPDAAASTLKRVEAIDPDNATAFYEVADGLAMLRQYDRAETMYKVAIQRAPWWNAPRNGLGLLYTQSGDESAARAALRIAHELDPYNLRTTNYLRLLDRMRAMTRQNLPHFILMYDAKTDPIIPLYFPNRLEAIYKAVCADFQHEPTQTTMIEIFPSHDQFSVRTTGGSWIETVGASTGRVIALTAPRAGEGGGEAYDWSRVVRHEFTHTVTLSLTGNRIPHWFTEGLAVWEEHGPMPWEWAPMLYQAATKDKLFSLDALTWAFVRPKKPTDRQLAYAQSLWIVQYIERKWGHEAILKLLGQFRDGQTVAAAFQAVLNLPPADFDKAFAQWAKQRVSKWGYDPGASRDYKLAAEKGTELIQSGDYAAAVACWKKAAQLRPMEELPHLRLAGLYLHLKQNDLAVEELDLLSRSTLGNNAYARRAAELLLEEGKTTEAARQADRAIQINLYDPAAHRLRLKIAQAQKETRIIQREQSALELLQTQSP